MSVTDLGATLRALRRADDLSQRALADRAGVPWSTVARIESGTYTNPRFRTIERLVEAAGGRIAVTAASPASRPGQDNESSAEFGPPGPVPHEHLVDAAGRHYPPHLDVRAAFPMVGRDWKLLRAGTPVYQFHLDRESRNERRADRAKAADLRIERSELAADQAWQWTAQTADGATVGWLVAQIWPYTVTIPGEPAEAVVCRLSAAPGWRRIGLEEQLLSGLRTEIADRAVSEVVAIAYSATEALYLRGFGFHSSARVISTLRINLEAISPET